jgi:hypothetical protein
MTPEDKASQLLRRFTLDFTMDFDLTRQASTMCVYHIIDALTEQGLDTTYWQKVRDHLYAINNGLYEAKSDRFNLNA